MSGCHSWVWFICKQFAAAKSSACHHLANEKANLCVESTLWTHTSTHSLTVVLVVVSNTHTHKHKHKRDSSPSLYLRGTLNPRKTHTHTHTHESERASEFDLQLSNIDDGHRKRGGITTAIVLITGGQVVYMHYSTIVQPLINTTNRCMAVYFSV